jgi:hypothetical protein
MENSFVKKGLEYIEPVPLEPPHKSSFPTGIIHLYYFNEWTLTFEKES